MSQTWCTVALRGDPKLRFAPRDRIEQTNPPMAVTVGWPIKCNRRGAETRRKTQRMHIVRVPPSAFVSAPQPLGGCIGIRFGRRTAGSTRAHEQLIADPKLAARRLDIAKEPQAVVVVAGGGFDVGLV